jgi:branched-chain amino acid transport system permease protein
MWIIGFIILGIVIYGAVSTIRSAKYDPRTWVDLIVFGIAQGSVYALIALGYTMVYGILRMINFAHGEVFMAGSFAGYFVATGLESVGILEGNFLLGQVIIFLAAMTLSATIAVLLERIAYRPLRRAPRLVPLITAIGASFFLQYSFRGFFGSGVKGYPLPEQLKGAFVILGFVQRTKTGRAIQAVSEDKDASALMGIDVDRSIFITFLVGGALAGAAGVLFATLFRQVYFLAGFIPGLKAFTAAVLGGIGNIAGAMVGGLFLGVAESLFPLLVLDGLGIPAPYQLKDALAFLMLVLVLIFRPTGILGERLATKKA